MPRILIVDDDPSIRRTLQAHFAELGFEVLDASSAEAALNGLSSFDPDVVLTDIQLTGMTGLDLLARTRERMPGVDVIVFTGYAGVQGAIDAIKGGAYDYLSKPLDLDQVEEVVQRCVSDRQGRSDPDGGEVTEVPLSPADGLVGRHPAMLEVFKTIGAVSDSKLSQP